MTADTPRIRLAGINRHNLRNVELDLPLGRFVAVTGVSGSGKSTLVMEVLAPAIKAWRDDKFDPVRPAPSSTLPPPRVVCVDQSTLGRTSRSTPATYSGIWDAVRKVFALTKESRARGFQANRFSFTSPAGRCPDCKGLGTIKVEMKFLPDVQVLCSTCRGMRFNRQTLAIHFRGKNVAEVLRLRIDEAVKFFAEFPAIRDRLALLADVGLGYVELGQSATTLSGGEAQRVRLATELSLPGKLGVEPTLFILDEPTTGLHPRDIERLVDLLHRLVADGHSVVVIEHELALIAAADWIIDMGPEGGSAGGRIIAACPPAELSRHPESHTGRALADHLGAAAKTSSRALVR